MEVHTRKITKTNYSYTVTLPKEWVKGNRLDYGSKVEFDLRKNGALVIKPHKA